MEIEKFHNLNRKKDYLKLINTIIYLILQKWIKDLVKLHLGKEIDIILQNNKQDLVLYIIYQHSLINFNKKLKNPNFDC